MNEQKFLCNIKFEGKRFKIFSNDYHMKTFLEILEDGSLCYPLLEDYKKLDKIYNIREHKVLVDLTEVKFEPKVIDPAEPGKSKKVNCKVLGLVALRLVESVLTISQQMSEEDRFIKTMESKYDTIIEKLPSGLLKTKSTDKLIFIDNNDELRGYVENPNPTFDDVRRAIEENENIYGKRKVWLKEYVDKLEEKCPNTDCICLYYNVSMLRIEQMSKEEIRENQGKYCTAYFTPSTYTITIPEDSEVDEASLQHSFEHEASHMVTEFFIMDHEGKVVIRTNSIKTYDIENDDWSELGIAWTEGLTEELRFDITPQIKVNAYNDVQDIVELILNTSDLTIYDLLENNIEYVMECMMENGIKDPCYIFESLDVYLDSVLNDIEMENNIRQQIYESYFSDLTEKWIDEGQTSGQIYRRTIEAIDKRSNRLFFR